MTEKICCFTGHRRLPDNSMKKLPEILDKEIEARIGEGYTVFRAGGACGFDAIAAMKVIVAKNKYGFVKLELCLPCKDQDKYWSQMEKTIYRKVMEAADSISYAEERYTRDCMYKRNRMLVDGSDCCIGFCLPGTKRGGTLYTMNYAVKKGVECKNLHHSMK